ncbi:MAG: TlpA family protein disulfide reductase, partial [Caldimonas sp.]
MNHAVQLGPLLLPMTLLLVLASTGATLFIAHRLGRNTGINVDGAVWQAVLVGLVLARLGFVFEYRTLYLAAPLGVLDIRDGGWNPAVGLVAAWLYALQRAHRAPALAKPLRWAGLAGSAIFVAGSVLLSFSADTQQKLPSLAFTTLEGPSRQLDAFVGKPTVVNLWAT